MLSARPWRSIWRTVPISISLWKISIPRDRHQSGMGARKKRNGRTQKSKRGLERTISVVRRRRRSWTRTGPCPRPWRRDDPAECAGEHIASPIPPLDVHDSIQLDIEPLDFSGIAFRVVPPSILTARRGRGRRRCQRRARRRGHARSCLWHSAFRSGQTIVFILHGFQHGCQSHSSRFDSRQLSVCC